MPSNSTNRRRRRRALAVRKAGEAAALAGKGLRDNPYKPEDWQHSHWIDGHYYGFRAMAIEELKLKAAA